MSMVRSKAMRGKTGSYLSGQLLVAMPGMKDPRFAKTVIYMCAHSADGAMGLVVNRELQSLPFPDMLPALSNRSLDAGITLEPFLALGQARTAFEVFHPVGDFYPDQQIAVLLYSPQFAAQTKDRLTSREGVRLVERMLRDPLEIWLNQHVEAGRTVAELAIRQALARTRAAKTVERKR